MKWFRLFATKDNQPPELEKLEDELELICSRVLGLYLSSELVKDRSQEPLDELLQEAIDRALIAASELDKKYNFGLF
jgi:hypothetical protein